MKKTILFLSVVFAFVFVAACSTKMTQTDLMPISAQLLKNKAIYIAVVDDGSFNGRIYAGSGLSVANYFQVNCRPYASKVIIGNQRDFLNEAKNLKADYAFRAIITHWEPRSAAWSGIPTKVEINIAVYNASDGKELVNTTLAVRGRAMTFANQSAEGLAAALIKDFCQQIFN
ncbi:MAG: DUF4823 domain-containing protein [Elusimicrobiota bacterium]|jgi:hypothetical protein|nr:DUF4823 domain-containing protein [Elusimicrobiota bacterium]